MKSRILCILLFGFQLCHSQYINPIDSSFGTNGLTVEDINSGSRDRVLDFIIDNQRRIVVVGETDGKWYVTRFDANGNLDLGFGSNGSFIFNIDSTGTGRAQTIEQLTSGKYLVGGFWYTTNWSNSQHMAVARVNANGGLDTTFGNNGTRLFLYYNKTAVVTNLEILQNGNFYAYGDYLISSSMYGSFLDFAVVKMLSNGDIDTLWGDSGRADQAMSMAGLHRTTDMAMNSNGQQYIASMYHGGGWVPISYGLIARLHNNRMELDTNFGFNLSGRKGLLRTELDYMRLEIQSNDKMIVGGSPSYNYGPAPVNRAFVIKRFHPNGVSDTSFGDSGTVYTPFDTISGDYLHDLAILDDDRILAIGRSGNRFAMARYLPDGELDTICYPERYIGDTANLNIMNLQDSGRVVCVGADGFDINLSRYNFGWPPRVGEDIDTNFCGQFVFNGKTYNSSGLYTDTFPSIGGCDSFITINLAIQEIETNVTHSGPYLTAWADSANYQWIDCSNNSPISGATFKSFIAPTNGPYAVVVTQNGCSDTSACYNVTGVGINDYSFSRISVYPNPSNGSFTIDQIPRSQNIYPSDRRARINIQDLQGKTVYGSEFEFEDQLEINLEVEKGVYLLMIQNGSGQVVKKLIIQ